MKIILKEDMPNLGFKGEIVDVKAGYGLSLIHISEPTRQDRPSRMPSSA